MRILFLVLISFHASAQITFERGYLIYSNGNKIDCLIKNVDWLYNPTDFFYKTVDGDSLKKGDLSSVREFGVYGYSKFASANVKIDRSKLNVQDLTTGRNPVWTQERLFLKVLVEGKANLYSYEDNNLVRFFYSINDSTIEQLVYKKYITDNELIKKNFPERGDYLGSQIGENNLFRQQLFNSIRCKNNGRDKVEKIKYKSRELEEYFNDYNRCMGSPGASAVKKEKKLRNIFNIKIAPGLSYPLLNIYPYSYSVSSSGNYEFKKTTNFRLGAEFEFLFPFNKNKWSFVFEPTYQTLQSSAQNIDINFNCVEFPFGFRHYLFLNRDVKIFLDCFFLPQWNYRINNHNEINIQVAGQPFSGTIQTRSGFALGFGAEFQRLSLEARYYTSSNILYGYYWTGDYRRLSFIVGYKFLKLQK